MQNLDNSGLESVYNLGNGKGWSVLQIVTEVEKIFGVDLNAQIGEIRKGEVAKKYTSPKKVERELGWVAKKSLADSVNSLRSWYEKHPKGWDR